MKKITLMTAIMVIMAGSAYAGNYLCVCAGNTSKTSCSSGDTFGMNGSVHGVKGDKIKKYIPDSGKLSILNIKGIGYDPTTGWACSKTH